MPRASNGDYALPSSYRVNDGDTIRPAQHNPPFEDLQEAVTGSLSRDGYGGMRSSLDFGGFRGTNLAPGVNPTDAVTVSQLGGSGIPVGSWIPYGGDTPPIGYLLCFGQAVSRSDYAELFAVIGTKFGSGDGTSTFNIPDLRGRVTVGRDDMGGTPAGRVTTAGSSINGANLGASGGSQNHQLTTAQMPSHNHSGTTSSSGSHTHTAHIGNGFEGQSLYMDTGSQVSFGFQSGYIGSAGDHTHSFTTNNQGGGQAHNNMQPSLIGNFIIRARS